MAKKRTKKKKPKERGRPETYNKRYCKMLINFFDVEPYTEVLVPKYDESGKTYKSGPKKGQKVVTHFEVLRNPNRLPTLRAFAKKIGVHFATVYRWMDKKSDTFHQEFCDAFARAREIRKFFLIENGLVGCHNPHYSKFVTVNLTDMKDTSRSELTGADGEAIPLEIVDFSKIKVKKPKD